MMDIFAVCVRLFDLLFHRYMGVMILYIVHPSVHGWIESVVTSMQGN